MHAEVIKLGRAVGSRNRIVSGSEFLLDAANITDITELINLTSTPQICLISRLQAGQWLRLGSTLLLTAARIAALPAPQKSSEKLWLKDFLPGGLPKSVRVMLFEYNSSPAKGATSIKLNDHAKNLLQWLSLKRKASSPDAPQRPLVFICHSLGGLVVKEALVEGTIDTVYKSIVEATRLLVFFATPHQGGSYATVGDIAATIVRAGLRRPSNDLINSLKQDSDEATRRFEQSRHLQEIRNPACELVIGTIATELERALELERL
ncbi:uncharacterized protein PAC_18247 [Phialocephala subalpina]|uniref:DUF676 domain-containing protein n=1 Tax=Phialocephala subalpina TaxID=576137 RepID=A0A1L7XTP2_9HELO|nr:uncharacterized protein PAC_18247 [Phialocephala subalpina]